MSKPKYSLDNDETFNIFFEENSLYLLDEKINFIYANNGTGKTFIKNQLIKKYDNKFCEIKLDNILSNDSNALILHSRAEEIKKLSEELEEEMDKSIKSISEFINNNELSIRSNFYLKHLKKYLDDNCVNNDIHKLFCAKDKMKNIDDYKKNLLDNNDNLNKCSLFKLLEKINCDFKELKFSSLEENNEFFYFEEKSFEYEKLKNAYEFVKELLKNKKDELKNEITKTILPNEYNFEILSKIYDSISNLTDMQNCYICFRKIDDFNEIKNKIQKKLQELEKNILFNNEEKENLNFINSFIKENELKINHNKFQYQKIDEYLKIIENLFKTYNLYVTKKISHIKNILDDSLIERLKNKFEEIKKLEDEKTILNEELFSFFKELVEQNIGNKKIIINKSNDKFIEIKYNGDQIPLSSGEITLVSFIFNLFINQAINENKFFIIDDVDDSIDKINRVNIEFIIWKFYEKFKTKFLILTHNSNTIKEFVDSKKIKLNVMILHKLLNLEKNNELRNIITIENNEELDFFSFKDGIKKVILLLKKEVENLKSEFWSKKNNIILFLYVCYILRIYYYVFKNIYENDTSDNKNQEKINNEDQEKIPYQIFFDILKKDFIFNNDNTNSKNSEKIFNGVIEHINEKIIKDKKFYLPNDYKEFRLYFDEIRDNFWEIEFESDFKIIKSNISNLIKLMFCREEMDQWENYIKDGNINGNIKYWKDYYEVFLNTYYHNEINPSLILSGIEFNDNFIKTMEIKIKKIKENIGK